MSFNPEDGPRFLADVICVVVEGNEAILTAVIKKPASNTGDVMVMHAVDKCNPSESTPDLLRGSFVPFIFADPDSPGCFLPVDRS